MDKEVVLPKGIFTRRFNYSHNNKQHVQDLLTKHNGIAYQIAKFKFHQTVLPDESEARKVSEACSSCFPNHKAHLDYEVKIQPIQNVFDLPTADFENPWPWYASWFRSRFPDFVFFWRQGAITANGVKKFKNEDVFLKATNSLKETFTGEQELKMGGYAEETKEIHNLIKELCNDICDCGPNYGGVKTRFLMRLSGWLLSKFLGLAFTKICVHRGEIELLDRVFGTDLPILFVPISRSQMDPYLLHFTLMSAGLPVPYFYPLRGDKMVSSYLGGLNFRSGSESCGKEGMSADLVRKIRSTISVSTMSVMLKNGCNIVLPLESARSRDGKPSTELYGIELLSELCSSFVAKEIEDAHVVPFSVSYETLPEFYDDKPFVHNEISFWGFLKKLWLCRKAGLGMARVNFSQAFTLREYRRAMQKNSKMLSLLEEHKTENIARESYYKTFYSAELCWNAPLSSHLSPSISSLYDIPVEDIEDPFDQYFIDCLAFHTVYASFSCTSLLPTHLVGFLLLKKYRQGTTLNILVHDVEELKEYLINWHSKDVGFTGDTKAAVIYALYMLRNNVEVCGDLNNETTVQIKPKLTFECLREMNYYANHILPIMIMECVVATAMCALHGNEMKTSKGFEVSIRITDPTLVFESRKIYETISSEFLLHSPCTTANMAIRKTFEKLNTMGLLEICMDDSMKRTRRCAFDDEVYDEREYDDEMPRSYSTVSGAPVGESEHFFIWDQYKINCSDDNISRLQFLKSLLVPYLEIYSFITRQLKCLSVGTRKETGMELWELTNVVLQEMKMNFSVDEYGEFLSANNLKGCFLAFEEHGIIFCQFEKDTKLTKVYLDDAFTEDNNKLLTLSENILRYATF